MINAFDAIAFVAEQKIREAMEEGQFEELPGQGKPLQLEDLSNLPADMRMAYTLLKNSGYLRQEGNVSPATMAELLERESEESRAYRSMQRFTVAMKRVREERKRYALEKNSAPEERPSLENSSYFTKILQKVSVSPKRNR